MLMMSELRSTAAVVSTAACSESSGCDSIDAVPCCCQSCEARVQQAERVHSYVVVLQRGRCKDGLECGERALQ